MSQDDLHRKGLAEENVWARKNEFDLLSKLSFDANKDTTPEDGTLITA